jgi:hypothetical protein
MGESQSLREIRMEHILLALRSTLGDVVQASKILGSQLDSYAAESRNWESMLSNGKT